MNILKQIFNISLIAFLIKIFEKINKKNNTKVLQIIRVKI
jgi:hypothetical protein